MLVRALLMVLEELRNDQNRITKIFIYKRYIRKRFKVHYSTREHEQVLNKYLPTKGLKKVGFLFSF